MNDNDSPQLTDDDIARLARNHGKPAPKELIDSVFAEIERQGIRPFEETPEGRASVPPPKIDRTTPDR